MVVDEKAESASSCKMDKRYQVFVSSTYVDLVDERQIVFQTLMEMDCIPAGMEYFSAIDEDQFEFIKKVIDDCDYYLLIIGGKYGSLAEDQISYTEKEFDYAIFKGKKVVVLVHKNPDAIPAGKSESNPDIKGKLEAFKAKAMNRRLVDFWEDARDLKGLVALSMNKTIKMFPAVGWVRGNKVASEEILEQINDLRKRNEILEGENKQLKTNSLYEIQNLADLDDLYTIELKLTVGIKSRNSNDWNKKYNHEKKFKETITLEWKKIFSLMADDFLYEKAEGPIQRKFANSLGSIVGVEEGYSIISASVSVETIKEIFNQLMAYGLISSDASQGNFLKLILTEKGKSYILKERAVFKQP